MKIAWVFRLFALSLWRWFLGFELEGLLDDAMVANETRPLMVNLTLITSAASKGAVCLDGSLPGYHFHPGFGSGANNWLVNLEGGGWCNNHRTCIYRKKTPQGSSNYMEKEISFTGILSDKPEENPDFFNWNRVKVRYCDGASFTGEGFDSQANLFFRGERIWQVAMEDLLSKGMRYANQTLLSGGSAGGLAAIQHCDKFRELLPGITKVKCLADAGIFLDAVDVAGSRTLRSFFEGVVTMQGSGNNLPRACTAHMDGTSCFFPENVVSTIQTPTFLLNSAYDIWQVTSLATKTADPHGYWVECKFDYRKCNASQIQFLHRFRKKMLDAVKGFNSSRQNGLFINSCFAHSQTEIQDTWFADNGPRIRNMVCPHVAHSLVSNLRLWLSMHASTNISS